nr:MAG TPA: hypothetical protein [Caudoviricetes sp.]
MELESLQQGIVSLLAQIPLTLEYDEPRAKLHAALFRIRTRPEDITPEWWGKKLDEVQRLLEEIKERHKAFL